MGPDGRSGRVRKISSPKGFDPWIVQSVEKLIPMASLCITKSHVGWPAIFYFFCISYLVLSLYFFCTCFFVLIVHASGGIRIRNPSKRAATDLCLTACGHRDRRGRTRVFAMRGLRITTWITARTFGNLNGRRQCWWLLNKEMVSVANG